MKAAEYRKLRQQLGTQDQAAEVLDITAKSIRDREGGYIRIRREVEFAIRYAVQEQKRPAVARRLKPYRNGKKRRRS